MWKSTRRDFLVGTAASSSMVWVAFSAAPAEANMIEPVTPTEHLMYTTARIVGLDASGKEIRFGTGFFYQFPVADGDDRKIPIFVTNKHVINGTSKASFLAHTVSDGGKKPDGNIQVFSDAQDWIPHPNPQIDLCAAPMGGVMNAAKPPLFLRFLDPSIVPSDEALQALSAVEDVLMVGYPNGLWDSANNYPLIRRGITASHPAVDFVVDGAATTVIDMACFPGSSGSPVILYSPLSSFDKKANTNIMGAGKLLFLGILFSGPTIESDGTIVIKDIPTVSQPVAQLRLMMNLGYIIKSKELAALGAEVLKKIGPVPPKT
jgi:hypothetical protein